MGTLQSAASPFRSDTLQDLFDAERFTTRSPVFDHILRASHLHFWSPTDRRYIDFDQPFDLTTTELIPRSMAPALATPHGQERLPDPKDQIRFVNGVARWQFSSLLYGEQAALSLSASLCHTFPDLGTQEYAANQAREEARHVTAFARYISIRWGKPAPCGGALRRLLTDLIATSDVNRKIVGMQVIVEGLAMGAFATGYKTNRDPVARRLFQLVMTDEAFHHRFGNMWAARILPDLCQAERDELEDWVAYCFSQVIMNLVSPAEMASVYEEFGLDVVTVTEQMRAGRLAQEAERHAAKPTSMFRVVAGALMRHGLITERTRGLYPAQLDLSHYDLDVADPISQSGLAFLAKINGASEALAQSELEA